MTFNISLDIYNLASKTWPVSIPCTKEVFLQVPFLSFNYYIFHVNSILQWFVSVCTILYKLASLPDELWATMISGSYEMITYNF